MTDFFKSAFGNAFVGQGQGSAGGGPGHSVEQPQLASERFAQRFRRPAHLNSKHEIQSYKAARRGRLCVYVCSKICRPAPSMP